MRAVLLSSSAEAGWSGARWRLDPARVLYFATFLLLTANVARVPLITMGRTANAPLLVNDLGVALVLIVGGVAMLRSGMMRLDGVAIAAALFATVGALSTISGIERFGLDGFELLVSLAYLARWTFYFGLYLVVINCVRERDAAPLWSALETTMVLFAAFGIVQVLFLPDFGKLLNPEWQPYVDYDPQGRRLMSTVLEPNIAAAMIAVVLLVQLAMISVGVRVSAWKPLLMLIALALTVSRSGLLGLLMGGLVILATRGLSKRLWRFAIPIFVLVLAALPRLLEYAAQFGKTGFSDPSAAARLIAWGRALGAFLDHPWIGIGFNTYAFVQDRRGFEVMNGSSFSVEGGLLFVAVMTGIVGLAIYLTMLWFVFRTCRRTWRDPAAAPLQRGIAIGAVAATVAVVVHSVFVNSLLVPFVMQPLWILWGLAFVLRSRNGHRATAAPAGTSWVVAPR